MNECNMSYEIEQNNDYEEYQPQYDNFSEEITPMAVHQCNVCNKVFVNFKGLQQHSVIHTDSKPYICEICGRGFRFKSNMFEHRTVHTGYTPHHCPFCGKTFRLKGNMKKHMRTHVATKDELEAAYRPYASNRRATPMIPDNAIIVRGCAVPYYTPVKTKGYRKLQLGKDPSRWIKQLCNNELLPTSQIDDKILRIGEAVYRDHTYNTLFEISKSIEFEFYLCPCCKYLCAGRLDCENHLMTVHDKDTSSITKQPNFCQDCMRIFADEEIYRQHQSYHSRVRLMLRNREIEGLTASPEIPFNLFVDKVIQAINDENAGNMLIRQNSGMENNLLKLPYDVVSSNNSFGGLFDNEEPLEDKMRTGIRSDIPSSISISSMMMVETNNNMDNLTSNELIQSVKGITTSEDEDSCI